MAQTTHTNQHNIPGIEDELDRQMREALQRKQEYQDWSREYAAKCAREGTAVSSSYARQRAWNSYQRENAVRKRAEAAVQQSKTVTPAQRAKTSARIASLQATYTMKHAKLQYLQVELTQLASELTALGVHLASEHSTVHKATATTDAVDAALQAATLQAVPAPAPTVQPWNCLQQYERGMAVFTEEELQAMWEVEQETRQSKASKQQAEVTARREQAALAAATDATDIAEQHRQDIEQAIFTDQELADDWNKKMEQLIRLSKNPGEIS